MGGSLINTTISHYRIISRLGAGGMVEVYLAEDTQLDRKVAIKSTNCCEIRRRWSLTKAATRRHWKSQCLWSTTSWTRRSARSGMIEAMRYTSAKRQCHADGGNDERSVSSGCYRG